MLKKKQIMGTETTDLDCTKLQNNRNECSLNKFLTKREGNRTRQKILFDCCKTSTKSCYIDQPKSIKH